MSEATGISYSAAVAILLVATLLYTSIGGMRAVIWTDVVQFFIFAIIPVSGYALHSRLPHILWLAGPPAA